MLRVAEPTKVCARCKVRKPWSAFQTRTRWEDGSTRTVVAYCRPCASAKRKEHYRKHPGSKATACRRWRAKIAQDPERLADYRAKQRVYHNVYRLRHGKAAPGHVTTSEVVDAAPLAAFFHTLGSRAGEVYLRVGMERSHVTKIMNGTVTRVTLDTVDRALLHANAVVDGLPVTLDTLYPIEEAAA